MDKSGISLVNFPGTFRHYSSILTASVEVLAMRKTSEKSDRNEAIISTEEDARIQRAHPSKHPIDEFIHHGLENNTLW